MKEEVKKAEKGKKKIKKEKENNKLLSTIVIISIIIVLLIILVIYLTMIVNKNNNKYFKINTQGNNSNIEKVEINREFDFDDLKILISGRYKIVKIPNGSDNKEYGEKDIIEIPVQVQNKKEKENRFRIGCVKIINNNNEETRELGSYFLDKSFEKSPKLNKDEMTVKNIYIQYSGDGEYTIRFKTLYEEKELKIDIVKK